MAHRMHVCSILEQSPSLFSHLLGEMTWKIAHPTATAINAHAHLEGGTTATGEH